MPFVRALRGEIASRREQAGQAELAAAADPRLAARTGVILGNLSYPTQSLSRFAEAVWLQTQRPELAGGRAAELAGVHPPHPINRFMSGLPALLNAIKEQVSVVVVILDNGVTAMTGFQPHPGTGKTALGEEAPRLSIESLCAGMDIPVQAVDPFDVQAATRILYRALQKGELQVVVMRHKCAVLQGREEGLPARRVWVDTEKCIGEQCGCNRFCSAAFGCPALIWDSMSCR